MAKILVVEDEATTARMIKDCLESLSLTVDTVSDGAGGMAYLDQNVYDLVILDYNLPDATGVELCRNLREKGRQTPVLFLTGRSDMADKIAGFNAGADDYLTKPFHPDELTLRVRALLRRPRNESQEVIIVGDLEIDLAAGKASKAGVELKLRLKEFQVLAFLARNKGKYFTGEALLNRVWETDSEATEIAIRSCVSRLRRAIDSPGENTIIESERGRGYRLRAE